MIIRVLIMLSCLAGPLCSKVLEPALSVFLLEAEKAHGEFGKKAAQFLIDGMPPADRTLLKNGFLMENLKLAFEVRERFVWAQNLPEEVFLNDVLPYASLDETRESWRAEFLKLGAPLVTDAQTSSEAAQMLNKGFFKQIGVHYSKRRNKPNQSPAESRAINKASCTGLSIILVDACRAVGVPARVAGTPLWTNKRGNHTWVEIYDGGDWHFLGADEYDPKGLNHGWFTKDAGKAIETDWKHAIWATSWKKTKNHFPMVWNLNDQSVSAVNVTARYTKDPSFEKGVFYLRLWDQKGGDRLVGDVTLTDHDGKEVQTVTTKAGTSDLNEMPSLILQPGPHQLKITVGEVTRSRPLGEVTPDQTLDLYWAVFGEKSEVGLEIRSWLSLLPEERHLSVPKKALSRREAREALRIITDQLVKESQEEREVELTRGVIKAAGKEMRYLEKTYGEAPADGRSLWISMHGGGGAPARVNDQQWHNQIRLYEPAEGIYVAPRAPTNTWNLWHEAHIDDLFDRLITNMVALRGVNPNKIYLMGYSAGGDGVYQLAPRMADRYAAAAMMAGHPNGASPRNLRNLPFMIFMGGKDAAYKRNKIAAQWGEKLDKLQREDAEGYSHQTTIYEDLGHWMERRDQVALPWMAKHTRNPWPKKLIWHQSERTHLRFYWLTVDHPIKGSVIEAEVEGQILRLNSESVEKVTLRLSDQLVNLDQQVTVIFNGKQVFQGKVPRETKVIWGSLNERFDPSSVASATLQVTR